MLIRCTRSHQHQSRSWTPSPSSSLFSQDLLQTNRTITCITASMTGIPESAMPRITAACVQNFILQTMGYHEYLLLRRILLAAGVISESDKNRNVRYCTGPGTQHRACA